MNEVFRDKQRAFLRLAATIEHKNQSYPALVENLSATGMLLRCTKKFHSGESVEVNILLCPDVYISNINAVCVWENKKQIGIRFKKLTALHHSLLKQLVHYHRV